MASPATVLNLQNSFVGVVQTLTSNILDEAAVAHLVTSAMAEMNAKVARDQAREQFFLRIESLFVELGEHALDTDAGLEGNAVLLAQAADFIKRYAGAADLMFDRPIASFKHAASLLNEVAEVAQRLRDQTAFAEARFMLGRLYESRFDYGQALHCYTQAQAAASSRHEYRLATAIIARKTCNYALAVSHLEKLIDDYHYVKFESKLACNALNELGALYQYYVRFPDAVRCFHMAHSLAREDQCDEETCASIENNLGQCFLLNNDSIAATLFIHKAYQFYATRREDFRIDYINVAQNMAECLRKLARAEWRPIYPFMRELYVDRTDFEAAQRLARSFAGRELADADYILRESLAFAQRCYSRIGPHPSVAHALNNLGSFLASEYRDVEGAIEKVRAAVEIMENLFSASNPRLINMLVNLGNLEAIEAPKKGLAKLERAKDLASRIYELDNPIFLAIDEDRRSISARLLN